MNFDSDIFVTNIWLLIENSDVNHKSQEITRL